MSLPLCSRSKDVIEPMLKPQWWVDCGSMAGRAAAAVRSGELEVIPSEFEAVWHRWLDNIRDWCARRCCLFAAKLMFLLCLCGGCERVRMRVASDEQANGVAALQLPSASPLRTCMPRLDLHR